MDLIPIKAHFHIHWLEPDNLDWECFKTYAEAQARALYLARPGEAFQIDEVSTQCPFLR